LGGVSWGHDQRTVKMTIASKENMEFVDAEGEGL